MPKKKRITREISAQKVKILRYASNIWYFGEGMLGPLFAIFAARVGGDILDITWAWATYLLVSGLLFIVVGKLSDGGRYSKSKLMLAGYGLNAVFTFGYLLVDSPIKLFLIQGGLGVAAALANPTWDALYAKHEDKKHDGLTWGLATGEGLIMTAIAIIIGGLIVNYYSFTALFILMGTIQVIATVYQAKILFVGHQRKTR